MKYSRQTLWALGLTLVSSPGPFAAEWVIEPSVTLREEYDDNIRLSNVDPETVWGTTLDPSLKLSRITELWNVNARGRLRGTTYSGIDGLDTLDNFFDVAVKRLLERGSLSASASLVNDTNLQNEFLDDDTGLIVNQIDRTSHNFRLAGDYTFTEATWLEASVGYSTLEYDQGLNFGLLDYDYLTPGLRVVHQLDPKTQVFGIISHAKIEYDLPSPLESESTTNSLQLGAAYDITETWNVTGSVGSRKTESSQVTIETIFVPFPISRLVSSEDESTGLVYDASLTRTFETGSLSLSANQSVTPSSTGTESESTRISLMGNRKFSAQLSAQLAVSYYQTSTLEGETTRAGDNKNDRYRVAPSLTWRLDEDLALNAGYTYTRVERGVSGDDTVDSNAVFASLGYTWPRMSVSR